MIFTTQTRSGKNHSFFKESFLVFNINTPSLAGTEISATYNSTDAIAKRSKLQENVEKTSQNAEAKKRIQEILGINDINTITSPLIEIINKNAEYAKNAEIQILQIDSDQSLSQVEKEEKKRIIREKTEEKINTSTENIWNEKFPNATIGYKKMMNILLLPSHEIIRNLKALQQENIIQEKVSKSLNMEQDSSAMDYVTMRKKMILTRVAENHEDMKHLSTGQKEPFVEIIRFVQNGGNSKLSLQALQALKHIQNKTYKDKYQKKIEQQTNKITRIKEGHHNTIQAKQAQVILDPSTYQLAMIDIAQDAEKIIQAKGGLLAVSDINAETKTMLENITEENAHGYSVKTKTTDRYKDGAVATADSSLVNLENAFLYEVVGTWGIVTAVANILVAIDGGNWEQALPYIALGAGTTYATGKMALDHSLDKWRDPQDMPKWIMRERTQNEYYQSYFGNPWEVALLKNITFPTEKAEQKVFKNLLKGKQGIRGKQKEVIKEEKKKDKEKGISRNTNFVAGNLRPEHFSEGGILEDYLPNSVIGPRGKAMSKKEFLLGLQENGITNQNKAGDNIRHTMILKVLSRIGDNDSYLPHLNALQHYSINGKLQQKKHTQKTSQKRTKGVLVGPKTEYVEEKKEE